MTYLNLRGTTFRKTRSRRTCRREILDASGGQSSADASRRGRTNRICRCRAKPFREGRNGPCLHTPNIAQTCKAEAEGEGEIERDGYRYFEKVECRPRLRFHQG